MRFQAPLNGWDTSSKISCKAEQNSNPTSEVDQVVQAHAEVIFDLSLKRVILQRHERKDKEALGIQFIVSSF